MKCFSGWRGVAAASAASKAAAISKSAVASSSTDSTSALRAIESKERKLFLASSTGAVAFVKQGPTSVLNGGGGRSQATSSTAKDTALSKATPLSRSHHQPSSTSSAPSAQTSSSASPIAVPPSTPPLGAAASCADAEAINAASVAVSQALTRALAALHGASSSTSHRDQLEQTLCPGPAPHPAASTATDEERQRQLKPSASSAEGSSEARPVVVMTSPGRSALPPATETPAAGGVADLTHPPSRRSLGGREKPKTTATSIVGGVKGTPSSVAWQRDCRSVDGTPTVHRESGSRAAAKGGPPSLLDHRQSWDSTTGPKKQQGKEPLTGTAKLHSTVVVKTSILPSRLRETLVAVASPSAPQPPAMFAYATVPGLPAALAAPSQWFVPLGGASGTTASCSAVGAASESEQRGSAPDATATVERKPRTSRRSFDDAKRAGAAKLPDNGPLKSETGFASSVSSESVLSTAATSLLLKEREAGPSTDATVASSRPHRWTSPGAASAPSTPSHQQKQPSQRVTSAIRSVGSKHLLQVCKQERK